jgi:DNA invertase Pin-like site-specific DNA recombinase
VARTTAPPAHTTLAYLRVSTLDQDIEKNKADILRFANQHDLGRVRFIEEIASGRTPWRERRIAEVLEALGANDALIVAELSRLGRSMLECMEILTLATRKGIRVYSVKGNWHLDQSLQSKIIAQRYHTTEANLHNWLKKQGLKTARSNALP